VVVFQGRRVDCPVNDGIPNTHILTAVQAAITLMMVSKEIIAVILGTVPRPGVIRLIQIFGGRLAMFLYAHATATE